MGNPFLLDQIAKDGPDMVMAMPVDPSPPMEEEWLPGKRQTIALPPRDGKPWGIVDDAEEAEAKRLIEAQMGWQIPPVCGYFLLLMMYIPPERFKEISMPDGSKQPFFLAEITRREAKYNQGTALVVGRGPDTYRDAARFPSGPWCRAGDWVIVPRHDALPLNYKGVPMMLVPDDKVYVIVEDPAHVESINVPSRH